jgi:opacity protein-like surface antigen
LRFKLAVSVALIVCATSPAAAQEAYQPVYQPLYVVDTPTAGLLPRASLEIGVYVYGGGGVLTGLRVGFTDYLDFGISYGGDNVIGTGDVNMNPRPEVNMRVRVIQEGLMVPAVALGFDSQGYGGFDEELDRYAQKSRGLYAVASKNWDILGPFSLHGGLSYSFEGRDFDSDPTIFLGAIKTFGPIDLAAEYDFGLNDNEVKGADFVVETHGYLNLSVGWSINENFRLAVDARDILSGELRGVDDDLKRWREWHRGMRIEYRNLF